MNNVVLMFPRPMKRHLTSRVRSVRLYGSVGSREIHSSLISETLPAMDQAWKSINGFIVSFTSSFDQLKI